MNISGRKTFNILFKNLISAAATLILTSIGPASATQSLSSDYINAGGDYLDDRSSPESLLHSYYNAVVRQEYLRAFSYIDHRPQQPTAGEIQKFASGYEHTVSVRLKIGEENGDGGAGTITYCLPVALEATLDNGKKQVFSGSYNFRLVSALDQQMWPFYPLMITKGDLKLSHKPFEESVPASCDPDS